MGKYIDIEIVRGLYADKKKPKPTEDKLKNKWKAFKDFQKDNPDVDYAAWKQLDQLMKDKSTETPDYFREHNQYEYLKGHDSQQEYEPLYCHVEDNEFSRDDNIKFDAMGKASCPTEILEEAEAYREKVWRRKYGR